MGNTLAEGRVGLARICEIGQQRGKIRKDRKAADLAMTFQRNVLGTVPIWTMQGKSDLHDWLDKTLADFWDMAATKG
jgi:hypothetical protein